MITTFRNYIQNLPEKLYYDAKKNHYVTMSLWFIMILSPLCAYYLYKQGQTLVDPKVHIEFIIFVNNLQIINRNRILFPAVLFATLLLFSYKIIAKPIDVLENNDPMMETVFDDAKEAKKNLPK